MKRTLAKALLTVALLVVAGPVCMLSQTAKPIPPEWLHDGRIAVPDFNFSIASPNPEWHWYYLAFSTSDGKSTGFIAEVAPDTKYSVMVMDRGGSIEGTKTLADGMQKSLPKGWQITDVQREPSNVPLSGSSKFRVTIHLPDDSTLYAYNYVASGKKTYVLVCYSPETTVPPQFAEFVGSFALISPEANTESNQPNFLGIVVLWAIWGAIVDWKYKKRGGIRPTRNDKIGLFSAIGLSVATIVALGLYGVSGAALGSLTALLLGVIFPLWEFLRWRIRRNNPIPKSIRAETT